MMTEPDRDGMFSDLRLVDGGSVVTCTRCGALVADIEAHQRMHQDMVTLTDLAAQTGHRQEY